MVFIETPLQGAYIIEIGKIGDDRVPSVSKFGRGGVHACLVNVREDDARAACG